MTAVKASYQTIENFDLTVRAKFVVAQAKFHLNCWLCGVILRAKANLQLQLRQGIKQILQPKWTAIFKTSI